MSAKVPNRSVNRPMEEGVDTVDEVQLRTDLPDQIIGPIAAWFPGEQVIVAASAGEESTHVADVCFRGGELRWALEQNHRSLQCIGDFERAVPGFEDF